MTPPGDSDDFLRWMVADDEIRLLEAEYEATQARANHLRQRLDSFKRERADIHSRMDTRERLRRAAQAAAERLDEPPEPLYEPPENP